MKPGGHDNSQKIPIIDGNAITVIVSLTVPMIPGILSMMALDIIDSLLVAQLTQENLTAYSFSIPISTMLFGITVGLSIGAVSVITHALGSQCLQTLPSQVSTYLIASIAVAVCISFLGICSRTTVTSLLGANLPIISSLVNEYITVRYIGFPLWALTFISIGILRALGNTHLAAYLVVFWSMSTMILDGIFISLGFGLNGIALGHLLSDGIFSVVCLYFLWGRKVLTPHGFSMIRGLKPILKISTPACFSNMIHPLALAVVTYCIAQEHMEFVATFGILNRLETILIILPLALTTSLPVFFGQNWAAGRYNKVRLQLIHVLCAVFFLQLLLALVLLHYAIDIAVFLNFYDDDTHKDTVYWSTLFLSLVPFGYGGLSAAIILNSVLNAIHRAYGALVFSAFRVCFLYLPCVYIAYLHFGLPGLFTGMLSANLMSFFLVIFACKTLKTPQIQRPKLTFIPT